MKPRLIKTLRLRLYQRSLDQDRGNIDQGCTTSGLR